LQSEKNMERLKPLSEHSLKQSQIDLVSVIANGPRKNTIGSNPMSGPFGVWLRTPRLGNPLQALGAALRFDSPLDDQVREIVICTVGTFYRAHFEVAVHLKLAIESGVDQKELKKLCENKTPNFPEKHQVAYIFSTELLEQNLVSDETYTRAATFFTEEQLVALVSTIGYYCLISHTLNVFNIPLEENMNEPFN